MFAWNNGHNMLFSFSNYNIVIIEFSHFISVLNLVKSNFLSGGRLMMLNSDMCLYKDLKRKTVAIFHLVLFICKFIIIKEF